MRWCDLVEGDSEQTGLPDWRKSAQRPLTEISTRSSKTTTRPEVDKAIHSIKNNKSASTDGIHPELLKTAGESFNRIFHDILTKIWSSKKMSQEWNLSIICPVFKNGIEVRLRPTEEST
uniref:Reverse transcriptase domain-containing protein n=1 Tax=Megaselia scalaris TaxID=36166 RepID=T1GBW3_MEGSC